jgi:hypothetical protein
MFLPKIDPKFGQKKCHMENLNDWWIDGLLEFSPDEWAAWRKSTLDGTAYKRAKDEQRIWGREWCSYDEFLLNAEFSRKAKKSGWLWLK